jgi:periplasmic protein TonB
MSRTLIRSALAAALLAALGAHAQLQPVSKVSPEFPREAQLASVEKGRVKARLTLDASGEVTRVDIVDSNPRRVFDRAVVRSLSQWRYERGAEGRTVDVELDFKLQ